jgi:hypothetical protein
MNAGTHPDYLDAPDVPVLSLNFNCFNSSVVDFLGFSLEEVSSRKASELYVDKHVLEFGLCH